MQMRLNNPKLNHTMEAGKRQEKNHFYKAFYGVQLWIDKSDSV